MRLVAAVVCAAVLVGLGAVPSLAEKRVALVVGNDRYANLPKDEQLRKAVNDARAVGDALGRIGFQVIRGENLGRLALLAKFDELTQKLEPGDTAFFFFAGHGVAVNGGNYILPTDVPNVGPGQDTLLGHAALGETDIVGDLQGRGVRVAIVVLDACRNNPFKKPGLRSVGGERGLTRIEPVSGVFSLYSAGLGQTALDRLGDADSNPNSVFTRVLVPALGKPGLSLGDLAVEVREEVARLAHTVSHDQQPAYYDQTTGGRVYLAGLPQAATPAAPAAPARPPAPAQSEAERAWLAGVKDSTSEKVLDDFIRRFGDTIYGTMARERREGLKKGPVTAMAPAGVSPAPPSPCGTGAHAVALTSRPARPLSGTEECGLKRADNFKECDKCPEMIVVPAGSFTMGSPPSEPERKDDEGPQRLVTIGKPFAVGRFAITFDEWDACVADRGCNGYKPADQGWGRGRRPVINVSWDDAMAYVAWLSRKTGKSYRLLSEAEREYVTRAGTTTPFWWGTSITTSVANYYGRREITTSWWGGYSTKKQKYDGNGAVEGQFRDETVPVDTFQPNAWGLFQVHGNVSDWVEDCYHNSYAGAPSDGSAWVSGECSRRVDRGGCWLNPPEYLRSAYRSSGAAPDNRNPGTGFRVARTLTP
jgi:formylglycine-generating enzyme required for sulfatase activity/uncharacterized caspase-like protein